MWLRARGDPAAARLAVLSLFFGAHAAACAADAGDPLKVEGGATAEVTGEPDGGVVGDDASGAGDAPLQDASPSVGNDAPGVVAESSTPQDTGATMPDVVVGAGCAAGAVVIVLMPAAGQFTANSGNFDTAGPACVQLMGSVHQGWGLSNEQGRMLTLTSAAGTTGPVDATTYASLPAAPQAGPDGFVYWNFTAGMYDYTSLYVF